MAQSVTTYLEKGYFPPVRAADRPLSITLTCTPVSSESDTVAFFKRAVAGEAHLDMQPNLSCGHGEVAGGCGNMKGLLGECRCEVLDRKRHPQMRTDYENNVIGMVLGLIQSGASHLKLAAFCSGRLLGEEILLFRLFDMLKGRALGRLQLFLIDRCYQGAILKQEPEDYMKQFMREISQFLPKDARCDVTFFSEAEHYMSLAESRGGAFQHDLLIGADIYSNVSEIEPNNRLIAQIAKRAGARDIKPIILTQVKAQTGAFEGQICRVNHLGALIDCFKPAAEAPCLGESKLKSKRDIGIIIGVSGGVVFIVIVICILVFFLLKPKGEGAVVSIDAAGR